jgi:hypothetical protein
LPEVIDLSTQSKMEANSTLESMDIYIMLVESIQFLEEENLKDLLVATKNHGEQETRATEWVPSSVYAVVKRALDCTREAALLKRWAHAERILK